jgi:hypothetical protein
MKRRFPRPGAGFIVLAVGTFLVVGFLVWGFSTPLLDRVWKIMTRMEQAEFAGLEPQEVEDLERAIERYPELGRDILGQRQVRIVEPSAQRWSVLGRQHLLVSEGWRGAQILELQIDLSPDALPLEVHLRGPDLDETVEVEESGVVEIPVDLAASDGPILLRVHLDPAPDADAGRGLRFDARVPEVSQ